ncbi:MAG: nuclear transport factor 2 family protein [Novosphingobium sp.]
MADKIERDRDNQLDELLARQEILARLTAFSRGMDRFDREAYMSAFHPDAETAAGPFVGSAADCWDWAVPMHEAYQSATQHSLLNLTIEFDGDIAHSECYYMFVAKNRDDTLVLAGGRYIDRFEKRDGAWKIALRTNAIEWACQPPAIPLPFADVSGVTDNGAPARDRSDPSYRRPLTNLRPPSNPAEPG